MATEPKNEIELAEEAAEAVVAERTWPVVIKLKHPFEFDDELITELSFRRGRMGDLKGVKIDDIPPVDQLTLIASRMCGQPTKVIELLEDEDGAEVITLTLSFFARALGGGKTRLR